MRLQLIINGEKHEIEARTVHDLLKAMNLDKQAVAVEVNRQVVPKKEHDQTELKDGDNIELVTLVGGG
ncbi:MAG: sulfur carrier protein ThiS [Gammaproteobacteria bacterium]|nr:MAG: sulfur carrier protein ThiS [Gammaproteobacteria bacterium]